MFIGNAGSLAKGVIIAAIGLAEQPASALSGHCWHDALQQDR
ncbi:hypothetical protein [Paraperlucidibaca baekdonensis]|nr:hypothetical protein [Paraperlucidibaca baekdonensis]